MSADGPRGGLRWRPTSPPGARPSRSRRAAGAAACRAASPSASSRSPTAPCSWPRATTPRTGHATCVAEPRCARRAGRGPQRAPRRAAAGARAPGRGRRAHPQVRHARRAPRRRTGLPPRRASGRRDLSRRTHSREQRLHCAHRKNALSLTTVAAPPGRCPCARCAHTNVSALDLAPRGGRHDDPKDAHAIRPSGPQPGAPPRRGGRGLHRAHAHPGARPSPSSSRGWT